MNMKVAGLSRHASLSMDAVTPDDDALLSRCREGHPQAWAQLFDRHHDFVRLAARRLGTPPAELDDVVQDTFTVAFHRLRQFEQGRVEAWLFRIASNLVSNRHRRRRIREAFLAMWGRRPPPEPERADRAWEVSEAQAVVGRVLARMSPRKREVFALFELEGLSGQEIADRVGCNLGTVWTRLHHARRDFEAIARKQGALP